MFGKEEIKKEFEIKALEIFKGNYDMSTLDMVFGNKKSLFFSVKCVDWHLVI